MLREILKKISFARYLKTILNYMPKAIFFYLFEGYLSFHIVSGSFHIPSSLMILINSSTAFSEGTDFFITSLPL